MLKIKFGKTRGGVDPSDASAWLRSNRVDPTSEILFLYKKLLAWQCGTEPPPLRVGRRKRVYLTIKPDTVLHVEMSRPKDDTLILHYIETL